MARVYCGGQNGLVEFYDTVAAAWTDRTIPGMTGYSVKQIKIVAEDNIWVSFVQTAATVFKVAHWDGAAWAVYTSPTTALSTDYAFIVPIVGDGLYIYATRILHNSYANYIYHLTFDGVTWTQKWAGNPSTFQVSFIDFDGLSGSDMYLAGFAWWPGATVYIWHWTGSGNPVGESPGNMSPALPTYPPSYVESGWCCQFIKCLTADLVIAGLRYVTAVSPRNRIYAGKFGSTWTQELLLTEGSPDYEMLKDYYFELADKDGAGRTFFFTENSTQTLIEWIHRRSPEGVWTRIPMTSGNTAVQVGQGCAGVGDIMVHVGQGNSPHFDAVLTTDGGSSLQGFDRAVTYYCAAIFADTTAPTIDSNTPIGIASDAHTLICFSTKDAGSGVDLTTIGCIIDGVAAIVDGVFQLGWRGPASTITVNAFGGYDVVIDKETAFGSYVRIVVEATCEDNDGNSASLAWPFVIDARTEAETNPEPTMIEIALDDSHDVYLDATGDLALIAGVDAVKQMLLVGLKLFRGEWYLAEEQDGVPYYQDVLVNAPKSRVIEAMFRQQILASPGIERLKEFSMTIDRGQRKLSAEFLAVSSEGEVEVSEVFP